MFSQENQLLDFYSSSLSESFNKLAGHIDEGFGLNGFFYSYINADGYFFQIGNQPELSHTYFLNRLYKHNPFICHPDNYEHNQLLLTEDIPHEKGQKAHKTITDQYGFGNHLAVYKREPNAAHLLMFASNYEDLPLNSIFLNQKYALDQFADYFLTQWKDHFKKMDRYIINIAELMGPSFYVRYPFFKRINNKKKIKQFGQNIGLINNFAREDKLSKRERDCIEHFLKGKSAKEIGKELGISEGTVFDYLNNVKLKLGCFKKTDLFETLQVYKGLNLI